MTTRKHNSERADELYFLFVVVKQFVPQHVAEIEIDLD